MKDTSTKFVCLKCNIYDNGYYCSNCRSSLQIEKSEFPTLLAYHLVETGYVNIKDATLIKRNGYNSLLPLEKIIIDVKNLEIKVDNILVFDNSNVSSFHFAIILNPNFLNEEQITKRIGEIDSEITNIILLNKKTFQIRSIQLFFFLSFNNSSQVEKISLQLNQLYKTNYSIKFTKRCYVKCFDLSQGSYFPKTAWYDTNSREIYESCFEQLFLEETLKKEKWRSENQGFFQSIFNEFLKKPTKDIREFYTLFTDVLGRPMQYAHKIEKGKITTVDGLKYLALLIVFILIGERVFGLQELTTLDIFPFVNELLVLIFLLVGSAINAVLFFSIFRVIGGKGSLEKTFIASITVLIVTYPLSLVIDGIVNLFSIRFAGMENISAYATMGLLGSLYVPIFSVVHRVNKKKAIAGITICLLLFIALVFVGLMAFV